MGRRLAVVAAPDGSSPEHGLGVGVARQQPHPVLLVTVHRIGLPQQAVRRVRVGAVGDGIERELCRAHASLLSVHLEEAVDHIVGSILPEIRPLS